MTPPAAPGPQRRGPSRRELLAAAGVSAVGLTLTGAAAWRRQQENGQRATVFIGKAASYEADLVGVISAGLREIGLDRAQVRGKRILLKPNLVETATGHSHINTHPSVVVAAAEAFRRLDAATLTVAEGQGHRRDSLHVLEESGTRRALRDSGLRFVDLNHDEVIAMPNRGGWTKLPHLYLPRTVLESDFVVSLPKLKTHHWAGMTCAMKNFFGVMPGIVYGWPKNVLHWHGIHESILDINATLRPGLAIVDAIVGMEGDGPIMGTPRPLGCLVLGRNLPAVDATCARLMKLRAEAIPYLHNSSGKMGPILAGNIQQRGEAVEKLAGSFSLIDAPHLRGLRTE